MGLLTSFPPRAARTTPAACLPQPTVAPYNGHAKTSTLLMNMIALIGRYQEAIRGFSGFPAVSLPRLRFGQRIACRILIKKRLFDAARVRKNFFPEFPVAAGKGRGWRLPCRRSSLWRRGRLRLGHRGFLLPAAAREPAAPCPFRSHGNRPPNPPSLRAERFLD